MGKFPVPVNKESKPGRNMKKAAKASGNPKKNKKLKVGNKDPPPPKPADEEMDDD